MAVGSIISSALEKAGLSSSSGSKETAQDLTKVKEMAKNFIGTESKIRQEWERNAYVNKMYKQGHHWVNDMGVTDKRDPNQLRRQVNKFKSTLRAMKNAVTFNDPMIEVMPENGKKADQEEIDLALAYIRNEFDMAGSEEEGMKDLIKAMVDDAALCSWSMVSVMPNEDPDDTKINDVDVHDPMDVFFDNSNMRKARIIVVSSFEGANYLKSQGYQNIKEAQNSKEFSHSALKEEFIRIQSQENQDISEGKILIDNVYYIVDVDKGVDKETDEMKKEGKKKKREVWHCIISGEAMLKEPEKLKGYDSLSQVFFLYYMEKDKHVKYPTPWMTDVVPLQRSLNDASENIDTLLHWIAKVRFLQRAGSSNALQLIEDAQVGKIRYEGERPTFMEMPNIPSGLFEQVQMRSAQIEDAVGMHSASLGSSPGDRATGRLAAILKAGDSDNVAEPTKNLETVLSRIFSQMLENGASNITEVRDIYDFEGERSLRGIGSKSAEKAKEGKEDDKAPDAVQLKPFKNIKVTIVPGDLVSLAQARAEIIELMPVIAQNSELGEQSKALFKVLFRMFSVGTARDIYKTIESNQEEEEADHADQVIIRMEIEKLALGEQVTATPEQNHEEHINMKMIAVKEIVAVKGEEGPEFEAFMTNITQHESMLPGAGTKQAAPVDAFTGDVS